MSELDEGFRMEMAEYIRQEKELKVKLEILEQKLEKPEAKLAKAREIVLKAKAAYEACLAEVKPLRSDKTLIEGELEMLSEKKAKLRHDAAMAKGGYGMRPGTQAFVEQMNQLAGDPAEHKLKKETGKLDASAALEALKAKMGKD